MSARQLVVTIVVGAVTAAFASVPRPDRSAAPPVRAVDTAAATAPRDTAKPGPKRWLTGRELVADYLRDPRLRADAPTPRRAGMHLCSYVVLVPDPIDSRLDWQFDAGLEAVKRAFEVSGFVLDRFWLPWVVDADSSLRKRDRQNEPSNLRQQYPGVLLFRGADGAPRLRTPPPDTTLALVYLVPETPTTGVRRVPLAAALADRAALRPALAACRGDDAGDAAGYEVGDELRVVGPTFSGTVTSLRAGLDTWLGSPDSAAARRRHVTIVSGGATAAPNRVLMRRGAERFIDYSATINPVSMLLSTTCRNVLNDFLGIAEGEIALLTEGSTSFGRAVAGFPEGEVHDSAATHAAPPDAACAHSLVVPFPMSVSRLRAEYARHPASAVVPPAPVRGGVPRAPVDLEDPASAFENPPALSDLTAPSVERVMDDIGQTLLAHRTRVVIIAATDVRDRVFVADEIRRRLRDVRIVIVGSHALFQREEFNTELRGALVVSTYPLFTENQFWSVQRPDDDERIVFTNELAEGAYNATLFQLAPYLGLTSRTQSAADRWSDIACRRTDSLALADYRPPRAAGTVTVGGDARRVIHPAAARRPPVWVTVVGRTTIAPVQMYPVPDTALATSGGTRIALGCAPPSGAVSEHAATRTTPWEIVALYLTFAAAAAATVTARARKTEEKAAVRTRGDHSSTTDTALDRWLRRLGFTPATLGQLDEDAIDHQRITGILRPFVVATAMAPLILLPMRATAHAWPVSLWLVSGIVLAAGSVAVAAFVTAVSLAARHPGHDTVSATAWRHTVLAGGGTALYLSATVAYLGRVALLDGPAADALYTRALQLGSGVSPITPLLIGGAFLATWANLHYQRAKLLRTGFAYEVAPAHGSQARGARLALSRVTHGGAVGVIIAGFVVLLAWIFTRLGWSIEVIALRGSTAFDWLHRGLLVALLGLTVGTACRLFSAWLAFQTELRELDRQCYAPAFGRLPASLASLGRVTPMERIPSREARNTVEEEIVVRVQRLRGLANGPWKKFLEPVRTTRLRVDAREMPDAERVSSGKDCRPAYAESLRALQSALAAGHPKTPGRAEAEEVAALFAVDYVGWVVRHLRLLVIQTIAGLGLTTLFIASYPFEPQSLIGGVFFSVGVAAVVGLLLVLVQANRDPVLSLIAHTDPGVLTWDAPFVINLLAISAIPILTLLGSEFPQVRDFLFGWLAPLLKTVGHG